MTLSPRDRGILDQVARHRLTTNAVVHATLFADAKPNAAAKVTARLVRGGWLRAYPYVGHRTYFVLSPAATRACGVGEDRAAPLGAQALPTEAAVLHYCLAGITRRHRLTPAELAARLPWLPAPLRAAPHAVAADGCLELIRVDLGGPADHVARKCLADVTRRLAVPEGERVVRAGRLRLVVLTPTAAKADAVRRALAHKEFPETLAVHLAVVPDLFHLEAHSHVP
jgi:hypothetical protein